MALTRQGTRTRSVRPLLEGAAEGGQLVMSCRTQFRMWRLMSDQEDPVGIRSRRATI